MPPQRNLYVLGALHAASYSLVESLMRLKERKNGLRITKQKAEPGVQLKLVNTIPHGLLQLFLSFVCFFSPLLIGSTCFSLLMK